MMKLLLIKNITREGPGLLSRLLEKHSIAFDLIDLHKGEQIPDISNYSATIVFGGPDSANDQTSKMLNEIKVVQLMLKNNIPYLGICLGMQVLVKAAGGEVTKNPVKEIGWKDKKQNFFDISLTPEGKTDTFCEGLPDTFKIFQLHGETVKLTSDMQLLATGKYCTNQMVKVGQNAYGIQGHLELTPNMFDEWIHQDSDLKPLDKNELQKDYLDVKKEYEITGTQILTNFLKIAGLIK
jgi:GMP synthase (glutamine-hydrolysing)